MESKILIIGQAPPAIKQPYPYSTTMLYDWFKEVGINKEEAQELFIFEAVYNKFPGYNENGGHKLPSQEQMDDYWPVLECMIGEASKIIVLGNTAKDYLNSKNSFQILNPKVLYLMHPSKMNYNRYIKNKDKLISDLRKFIYD
jgi:uracil-DNA glycosylase